MVVVDAVAIEEMVPRGRGDVFAPVFVPVDVGSVAQDTRTSLPHVRHGEEGTNIEAYAVVKVRVPADGLLLERLPAHKDVVGLFAFQDQFQAFLQIFSGSEFFRRTIHAVGLVLPLAADPVAQVSVDQGFQQLGVESMVIN